MIKAGDPIELNGYYVVRATNPLRPSNDDRARGRSQHYAVSFEKGGLTLCNLAVSSPCQLWSSSIPAEEQISKMCVNCIARQKKFEKPDVPAIRDGLPMYKYQFTINTDASWSQAYGKTSAIAWWIVSNHYKITGSKLLSKGVDNSSVAELLAVQEAIVLLKNLIAREPFLKHYYDRREMKLIFNTDSAFVIDGLNGTMKKSKYLYLMDILKVDLKNFEVEFRHVKSHSKLGKERNSRQFVNDWCDQQAKQLLRRRIGEVRGRLR